jgi:hypothetical protein
MLYGVFRWYGPLAKKKLIHIYKHPCSSRCTGLLAPCHVSQLVTLNAPSTSILHHLLQLNLSHIYVMLSTSAMFYHCHQEYALALFSLVVSGVLLLVARKSTANGCDPTLHVHESFLFCSTIASVATLWVLLEGKARPWWLTTQGPFIDYCGSND